MLVSVNGSSVADADLAALLSIARIRGLARMWQRLSASNRPDEGFKLGAGELLQAQRARQIFRHLRRQGTPDSQVRAVDVEGRLET